MGEDNFYCLKAPLDVTPAPLQTRAANFDGFLDFVRHLGADPAPILDEYGLDPRTIRDPDQHIPCKSLTGTFEHCSSLFNDPLFGLHLAQYQDADIFGCVTALCRAAATFREALECKVNYIPVIHCPESMLEIAEGKEVIELRWQVRNDVGCNAQANYQTAALNAKLLRLLGGRNFRIKYVTLAVDARTRDIPEIERHLDCEFRTSTTMNAIAFSAAALDRPVASANRLLFRLVGGYLDRVKAVSRHSTLERVEDYIRGALPSGNCSIERCARKLGTSVRTLQARLEDQGLTFSDVLQRQRVELAKSHLEQCELSIDDVALLAGYSEQTSFGRAFKRWTGFTPQRYRQAVNNGMGRETNMAAA